GRFLTLDNLVDTQTGTVRAKARFENAERKLFPNQFVNLRLQVRMIPEAVVVPVTALRHGPSGDYVYVLNRSTHTVALRSVTRGLAAGERVQVATGLQLGEEVITEGSDRLRDGARVVLPGERPASGPMGAAGAGLRRNGGSDASGVEWQGSPASAASGASGAHWRRHAADAAPAS
ncbi:MAG TPA: efflux RND transporter periplasmic adaptor subunit, partial [Burkholderiaceae bacterium]|nr:efflux RND transporter periplasmic adaptor subunit [Burkholderiaceae bacterium]